MWEVGLVKQGRTIREEQVTTGKLRRIIDGSYLPLAYPAQLAAEAEVVEIYAGLFLWLPYKLVSAYMAVLPWVEAVLGTFLVLGLFPRVCSAISIPIVLSFIGANAVLFRGALGAHEECPDCFGMLYVLSHELALVIDILMLAVAVLIVLSRSNFLRLDLWFPRRYLKC